MRFKGTEIATMAAAGLALVGAIISGLYTYVNRNRELDIRLVEIGIAVLRADPLKETSIEGARTWALDLIDANAGGVKFTRPARIDLLKGRLEFDDYDLGSYDTKPTRRQPSK